jgi:hypothetical protein
MRLLFLSLLVLLASQVSNGRGESETARLAREWTFDAVSAGTLPEEFEPGTLYDGRTAGDWKVIEVKDAPSAPHVLAQLMAKGAEHAYKVVFVKNSIVADLELEVSFLAVGGKGDMGGGLIWRAADDRNYYLTRANPLEQNIRVYHVVKGVRKMLANFDQRIDIRRWHTLRVVAKDCRLQIFYDDQPVFDLCDRTFTTGRIGLWTKSDAVTYFDNLKLTERNWGQSAI